MKMKEVEWKRRKKWWCWDLILTYHLHSASFFPLLLSITTLGFTRRGKWNKTGKGRERNWERKEISHDIIYSFRPLSSFNLDAPHSTLSHVDTNVSKLMRDRSGQETEWDWKKEERKKGERDEDEKRFLLQLTWPQNSYCCSDRVINMSMSCFKEKHQVMRESNVEIQLLLLPPLFSSSASFFFAFLEERKNEKTIISRIIIHWPNYYGRVTRGRTEIEREGREERERERNQCQSVLIIIIRRLLLIILNG